MKAVLISIQPKWCELIASGKKTVEVRKTKPKIDVPFKCYIYCTNGKEKLWVLKETERAFAPEKIASICTAKDVGGTYQANCKVIGEFVCNTIFDLNEAALFAGMDEINKSVIEEYSCVDIDELLHYKGDKNEIYGWSISDLVIYDKPKELREFNHCGVNYHFNPPITRPPQSWCYVEERSADDEKCNDM